MNRKFKQPHLFKLLRCRQCRINNVEMFTVTFEQFNALLLNKSINFFRKIQSNSYMT